MNVIFHPTYRMNIDIQLSTYARNVSPQLGPKFTVHRFVSAFRAEYHMHHVLCVGMGHVPHLRCFASYIPRTQRLRAGLKYAAPPALEPRPNRHGAEEKRSGDQVFKSAGLSPTATKRLPARKSRVLPSLHSQICYTSL